MSYGEIEAMKQDYVHGNVDSIVAQKERVELDEVFLPVSIWEASISGRLTILMDGAPGVGKTTIAKKLCIDWAKGDLLHEYQLVVFVPLREANSDSIASLLPFPEKDAKEVADYLEMLSICGKYTLFILDGFDELSAKNRERKSIFMKLISGKILEDCSVLVTSRPYTSGALKRLSRVNKHIEVLGFTIEQTADYMNNLLAPAEATKLIRMLNERLDIASLCYTPLNCRIVTFVFEQHQYQLPATLTELYEIFVLHTIKRFQTKLEISFSQIEEVRTLRRLPKTILNQLNSLSAVAFECLNKDQLFITSDDLMEDISKVISLGLMSSLQSINPQGLTNHYQFLHLTIQEFLAARHIATFTKDYQLSFFRENINKSRFRLTLLFLAGLTKLSFIPPGDTLLGNEIINLKKLPKMEEIFLQRAKHNMMCAKDSDDEWSEFDLYGCSEPENVERREQQDRFLFLAHLIYETQKIFEELQINFQSNVFDLSSRPLSSFDLYIVSHFLSSTPKNHVWDVIDLSFCDIPSDSLAYRKCHLINGQPSVGITKNLHIDKIDISFLNEIINKNMYLVVTEVRAHWSLHIKHDDIIEFIAALNSSERLNTLTFIDNSDNLRFWQKSLERESF